MRASDVARLVGAVRHPHRPAAVLSTNARLRALWDDWAEGFHTGVRTSALRLVLIFVTLTSVGEGIMGTLMAPFVRDVLHASGSAYGLIMAAQALGGIIGGLGVAAIGNHFAARSLFGMGAVIFGILDLAMFLYPLACPALWPAFVLMLLVGLPATATIAGGMFVLQTATTDTHRGRVFGILGMSQGAGTLLGVLIAGTAAGPVGIVPVIAIQGAGFVVGGALVLRYLPGFTSIQPAAQPSAGATIA
jgi:MFS family permease